MADTAQVIGLHRNLLGESERYAADLADAELIVDGETFGKLVNIHGRTVRDLAQRDIIVKVGDNRYDLTASLRSYASHLREMAAGRGDEQHQLFLTAERARLAKEQADNTALKNAALRRELVPVAEVKSLWAGIVRQTRSKILAVPARIRQQLAHLSVHDVEVIDTELRRTLEELADDQ